MHKRKWYALLFKKLLLDDAIQELSLAEPQDLSRLCSATFGVCGNVWGSSNLEQVLSFLATFQPILGLEHIAKTKKTTIS